MISKQPQKKLKKLNCDEEGTKNYEIIYKQIDYFKRNFNNIQTGLNDVKEELKLRKNSQKNIKKEIEIIKKTLCNVTKEIYVIKKDLHITKNDTIKRFNLFEKILNRFESDTKKDNREETN